MIELYSGTPGSGKSAVALMEMMRHVSEGGIAASNFKLVPDWATRLAKVTSRRARRDPAYCLKLARKYWLRVFYVGDSDTVKSLSRLMKPKRLENGDYASGSKCLEKYCSPKYAKKREGMGKLFIDEAQLYFNSRTYSKNMGFIEFFTQHRKLRWDVIMIAHAESMIDSQIRELVEYNRSFRNLQKMKLFGIPVFNVIGTAFWSTTVMAGQGPGRGQRTSNLADMDFLNLDYAKMYDSMDVFGLDSLSGRISRQPAEGLWPKRSAQKRRLRIILGGAGTQKINEQEVLPCLATI